MNAAFLDGGSRKKVVLQQALKLRMNRYFPVLLQTFPRHPRTDVSSSASMRERLR